jgi:hypothetical protein
MVVGDGFPYHAGNSLRPEHLVFVAKHYNSTIWARSYGNFVGVVFEGTRPRQRTPNANKETLVGEVAVGAYLFGNEKGLNHQCFPKLHTRAVIGALPPVAVVVAATEMAVSN